MPISQKILLIQNDPLDAQVVRDALTRHGDGPFEVDWVRTCSEGLARLAARSSAPTPSPAAVLLDLFLPDSEGIETFDRIFAAAPQIPMLILSDSRGEEIAKAAVHRGAQDYLMKGRLDSYLLPKALTSMVDRAAYAEALFEEQERAQVTLNSIGDAVITTNVRGEVTYLNAVAEHMTGWSRWEADGHPIEEVFRIVDAASRKSAENPMPVSIRHDKAMTLTPNCILIRRDGAEAPIEDSVAPIHDRRGQVIGAVMVFRDVSLTRELTLRMSYLAQHDGLTDLPNRILLNDRLMQAMALAHRNHHKVSILFLDLDRFKQVNDSFGHALGDRLLQSVAQRLRSCVRGSDTISRRGGDEFAILLAEVIHAAHAAVTAEKILQALRVPHRIDDHDLQVTGSIGIATYPDDGMDADTLMKSADFAMYQAKDAGRDSCQFFMPEMNTRALERRSLETGLRAAVQQQEFSIDYQTKVDLETGAISGMEALVRWRHPQFGLLPPSRFVTIAEESGLIVPIGRWVLREACRQARAWQDAGLTPMCMAVNVSPAELRAKDFVAGVHTILAETHLDPRYLELELTETFLMQDPKATAWGLHALKDMGVRLALDDFGTGYSSLSYLRRFPIDTLKIDQSFVRDLDTDTDDASIVRAVIGLGESLHMNVVAEGVETGEQLAFLREHSCPVGQGFYFGRPVCAGELAQLLACNMAGPFEA